MLDEQDLDALAGAILGLDILSLELLRDIYEGEGYGATETEGLITALLADYSTEALFLFVYPLLGGKDLNSRTAQVRRSNSMRASCFLL